MRSNRLKEKVYLLIFGLALTASSIGEKLDLNCAAAEFKVESELSVPLRPETVRFINHQYSSFVRSDTWSTTRTIDCVENKTGEKECLSLNNAIFCKNPKDIFRLRSISDDNSRIVVQNRCNGGYIKYVAVSDPNVKEGFFYFMEDRMHFKIKNQLHADYDKSSYSQPMLSLDLSKKDGNLVIESFNHDQWQQENPRLTSSIRPSLYQHEVDLHNRIVLTTTCTPR